MKNNIKYPFPTASIFLFVSSFFYFINLVCCSELPSNSAGLTLPCLLRFMGVIALGIFLLVKRVPLGVSISIGTLLFAQLIEAFTVGSISSYYLYSDYDGLIFLQNLLIVATIIFTFLLSLTNFLKNGFVKLNKAWFAGIILSAVAYFIDLLVTVEISEFFPSEVEDVFIGNFLGNIFLCIAFCLMPRWFRDVAKAQQESNTEISEAVPVTYCTAPDMLVYDPYLYIESQPVSQQNDDETETLRKYKALYDEGVITKEEFEQKKKQIMSL